VSDAPPPVLAPLAAPQSFRLRARLLALLALGVVWVLPWFGAETGAAYAGAPAAFAFAVAWGLAATLSVARTREGLALGEAATSTALAALAAALSTAGHGWLRGGEGASSLVTIFAPLAGLCALDAFLRARRPGGAREVTVLRAGAALLAGASLAAAMRWVPAGAALAIGLLPLAAQFPASTAASRRALEAASLAIALCLLFAGPLNDAALGRAPSVYQGTIWAFLFYVLSLAIGAVAVLGVLGSDEAEAPALAPPPR
jgi:hypothetical protein